MAPTLSIKPGDEVTRSGKYRVHHAGHLPETEEVVIVRGNGRTFPTCKNCGDAVRFQPLCLVPDIDSVPNFNSSAKGPVARRRGGK